MRTVSLRKGIVLALLRIPLGIPGQARNEAGQARNEGLRPADHHSAADTLHQGKNNGGM